METEHTGRGRDWEVQLQPEHPLGLAETEQLLEEEGIKQLCIETENEREIEAMSSEQQRQGKTSWDPYGNQKG